MRLAISVECFVLNLTGIGLFALSCGLGGSVSIVMPVQTGANLLTNMFWQMCLGIKRFNKSMRIGTILLVLAVGELSEIGPMPPDLPAKEQNEETMKLLEPFTAKAWIAFLSVAAIGTTIASVMTLKRPRDSLMKLSCLTLSVSLMTVIGASVGKFCFSLKGIALIMGIAVYFGVGSILMFFTVLANAHTDVSFYIPAQLSSQLIINMVTGYVVWEDYKYLSAPVSYFLVYIICVLSVYLISPDLDLVGQFIRSYKIRKTYLSMGTAPSRFSELMLSLAESWGHSEIHNGEPGCLREMLLEGHESELISGSELIQLIMLLVGEQGTESQATVLYWTEQHVDYFRRYFGKDPDFREQLRNVLSDTGRSRLQSLLDSQENLSSTSRMLSQTSQPGPLPGAAQSSSRVLPGDLEVGLVSKLPKGPQEASRVSRQKV